MLFKVPIYYLFCVLILQNVIAFTITTDNVALHLEPTSKGIKLIASDNGIIKLSGTLGSTDLSQIKCIKKSKCQIDDYIFIITKLQYGFKIKWETDNTSRIFQDCFDLENGVSWYGGPTQSVQNWPIEGMEINGQNPYVVNAEQGFAYAERYWLNSKGAYIYLDPNTPLYVDQNVDRKNQICFKAQIDGPYFNRTRNFLEYNLIIRDNAKEAHLHAINKFLGKPIGHPNQKMIEEVIWTTWAKYKTEINDSTLIDFATSIRNQGYQGGQLEVDDKWEICYGAQAFSNKTFSNITNTVKKLKEMGFRVTLWIHPFVDKDCHNNSDIGAQKGFFVKDINGEIDGGWWNSNQTRQIDFTNPGATKWWSARVKKLQDDPGIDSFKFDAGETDYSPQPAVYQNVAQETIPNILTGSYLRECATFGSLVEVRTGWKTQDLPIFTRMLDKNSNWDISNGLHSLITTLLLMNINGYTMVLPDMIGGNGYQGQPSAELLVRWTQANVFMPAMQFSYVPWENINATFNASEIVKKYIDLHKTYSGTIINAMKNSIKTGVPVNPPIWWLDPTDNIALTCNDEFLVGDDILVAPVIVEGAISRNVYLPKGIWKDGNSENYYIGPSILNYSADINVLPFFIRLKDKDKTKNNYNKVKVNVL